MLEVSKVSQQMPSLQHLVCPYKQEKREMLSLIHAFHVINPGQNKQKSAKALWQGKHPTIRHIFSVSTLFLPNNNHEFKCNSIPNQWEPVLYILVMTSFTLNLAGFRRGWEQAARIKCRPFPSSFFMREDHSSRCNRLLTGAGQLSVTYHPRLW